MPLFQVTNRFNGKLYDVNWDPDTQALRVSAAVSAFPPPAAPPGLTPPIMSPGIPSEDQICAFEEGRLSHPKEPNPYGGKAERADRATSWAFGVLCK